MDGRRLCDSKAIELANNRPKKNKDGTYILTDAELENIRASISELLCLKKVKASANGPQEDAARDEYARWQEEGDDEIIDDSASENISGDNYDAYLLEANENAAKERTTSGRLVSGTNVDFVQEKWEKIDTKKLTPEKMEHLHLALNSGDKACREAAGEVIAVLINGYVKGAAKRSYSGNGEALSAYQMDAYQQTYLHLFEKIKNWDPSINDKLTTFANGYMRQALREEKQKAVGKNMYNLLSENDKETIQAIEEAVNCLKNMGGGADPTNAVSITAYINNELLDAEKIKATGRRIRRKTKISVKIVQKYLDLMTLLEKGSAPLSLSESNQNQIAEGEGFYTTVDPCSVYVRKEAQSELERKIFADLPMSCRILWRFMVYEFEGKREEKYRKDDYTKGAMSDVSFLSENAYFNPKRKNEVVRVFKRSSLSAGITEKEAEKAYNLLIQRLSQVYDKANRRKANITDIVSNELTSDDLSGIQQNIESAIRMNPTIFA